MSYDINVAPQSGETGIAAGNGIAVTAGGGMAAGTGTGSDAAAAPQTTEPVTSTSADLATPESDRQYKHRDLAGRLAPPQIYAMPNCWGDLMYWMDS